MKDQVGTLGAGAVALLAWLAVQMPLLDEARADEVPAVEVSALQLPEDLAENDPQSRSIPYQEFRVGGRLERITVVRENGVTEIYQNNRADTVWSADENEIGDVPNMRQWVIGTW